MANQVKKDVVANSTRPRPAPGKKPLPPSRPNDVVTGPTPLGKRTVQEAKAEHDG